MSTEGYTDDRAKDPSLAGLPDFPGSAADSSLSNLPDYPVNPFELSGVQCQECEQIRPRTRTYLVLHIIFLVIVTVWRADPMVKCPQCMRRYLCRRLPLALLLATILAPIVLLWWAVLFLRTFFP